MKVMASFRIHPVPAAASPWRIGLLWLMSSLPAWPGASLIVAWITGVARYLLCYGLIAVWNVARHPLF